MTRSPLFYPLNRGTDAEAGGAADLQTDVMRFMAILALCLVAIFALVQSIPLMPTYVETPRIAQVEMRHQHLPITTAPEPATAEPLAAEPMIVEPESPSIPVEEKRLVITRPAPQRVRAKQATQRIIEITTPPQVTGAPVEDTLEPTMPGPTPPAQSEGFTLRFETDLALTRLVARNEVGLYAITPEKSLRMNVNRGALSFWAASTPNQFHEMDGATVPSDVLSALRRSGGVNNRDVKWGVTLPPNMRKQLDRFLSESSGGSIIIAGDGQLQLEP